jgi:hypothetical protein
MAGNAKIDRRGFVAASLILATAPGLAQPADSVASDWGVFSKMADLFRNIQGSLDPIANGITRLKFVRFLNSINAPLADLLREKRTVDTAFRLASCEGDATTVQRLASEAARQIMPLVDTLQQQVKKLASAIKPAGTRAEATALANELGSLRSRKMWVDRTNSFCGLSPDRRAEFRAEVQASIEIVMRAQKQLDALIDKLSE